MRGWWAVTPPPSDWFEGQRWSYKYGTPRISDPRVIPAPVVPKPFDEEQIRRIVREEIADLPIPFDVPDAPEEA